MLVMLAVAAIPLKAYAESPPAETVRAMLNRPEARLNYLDAATTIDRLIDKDTNAAATRAMSAIRHFQH
jgi:hypothetical protein